MGLPAQVLSILSGAAGEELAALTQQLYAGTITLEAWEISVAAAIKDAHLVSGIFGAGGTAEVGAGGFGRIGGNLADEFKYLHNFAEQIAAGDISEAQALARIQQYASASEQAYWREFGDAASRPEWEGLPELNQVPRDGDTACLGNCNCSLTEDEDGLHWNLNPGESCGDCEALAAGGPYRPGNL